MGFFSQNCKRCGHPALHVRCNKINAWMTQVVVITPNGSILKGEYDGYGRLTGLGGVDEMATTVEYAIGVENTVYHQACWEVAGKPTEYEGPSEDSADQAYFYTDPTHDLKDPREG